MRFSKRECVLLTVLAVLLIWSVGRSRILEPAMERRCPPVRSAAGWSGSGLRRNSSSTW